MRQTTAVIVLVMALVYGRLAVGADWEAACQLHEMLAKQIMQARQNGIAMSKVVEIMSGSSTDEASSKAMTQMVIEAYSQPRYETDEMQQGEISDFANKAYLGCAKTMTKQ